MCLIRAVLLLIPHRDLGSYISPFVREVFLAERWNVLEHLINLGFACLSLSVAEN